MSSVEGLALEKPWHRRGPVTHLSIAANRSGGRVLTRRHKPGRRYWRMTKMCSNLTPPSQINRLSGDARPTSRALGVLQRGNGSYNQNGLWRSHCALEHNTVGRGAAVLSLSVCGGLACCSAEALSGSWANMPAPTRRTRAATTSPPTPLRRSQRKRKRAGTADDAAVALPQMEVSSHDARALSGMSEENGELCDVEGGAEVLQPPLKRSRVDAFAGWVGAAFSSVASFFRSRKEQEDGSQSGQTSVDSLQRDASVPDARSADSRLASDERAIGNDDDVVARSTADDLVMENSVGSPLAGASEYVPEEAAMDTEGSVGAAPSETLAAPTSVASAAGDLESEGIVIDLVDVTVAPNSPAVAAEVALAVDVAMDAAESPGASAEADARDDEGPSASADAANHAPLVVENTPVRASTEPLVALTPHLALPLSALAFPAAVAPSLRHLGSPRIVRHSKLSWPDPHAPARSPFMLPSPIRTPYAPSAPTHSTLTPVARLPSRGVSTPGPRTVLGYPSERAAYEALIRTVVARKAETDAVRRRQAAAVPFVSVPTERPAPVIMPTPGVTSKATAPQKHAASTAPTDDIDQWVRRLRALIEGADRLRDKHEPGAAVVRAAAVQAKLDEKMEPRFRLPTLSSEQQQMVERAWGPGNPSESLVTGKTAVVTRKDISTLAKLNWLNDEVINFYVGMITERSGGKVHCFNTFFYPKVMETQPFDFSKIKRWTRKIDVFSMDKLVVPVHLEVHWCLAVINLRDRRIEYYDSMGHANRACLARLREYIAAEAAERKVPIDLRQWSDYVPKDVPQQENGCDCGVFLCAFADHVSRSAPLAFSQADMPGIRQRMAYEILTQRLLT